MGSIFQLIQFSFTVLAVLLLVFSCPVFAQTDELKAIEVIDQSALPFQTGDVIEEENTGFSSTISGEDLHRPGLSLGDILHNEAGTQIQSAGGFGSYSELSLRGASGEQIMVYLDGLPLNDGSGGGVDLSNLDLSQLDRVEVYRGSTPLQLGKASFGGAVNLITHRNSRHTQRSAKLSIGSFNTQELSTLLSARRDKIDGLLSISMARSANDFEFINDKRTQFNRDDDEKQKRHNAEVAQYAALMKSGWTISEKSRLEGSLQLFNKEQGIPGWNNQSDIDASLESESLQLRTKFTNNGGLQTSVNTTAEVYLTQKLETYDDRNSDIGLGAQFDENKTSVNGFKTYLETIGLHSSSGLSFDTHKEYYQRLDLLKKKKDDESQRHTASLSLQHNQFLDDEKWLISPTLRTEWVKNKFRDKITNTQNDKQETYINGQIGLKYEHTDSLTFKSNYGSYIREPSFFELFGDRGLFLGNDSLLPEKGRNFDFGIEWNHPLKYKSIADTRLLMSAWYNEIDDMIVRTYDARGIGKSQNVAAARLSGIELELFIRFNNAMEISANATLQNPNNRSKNAAFKGKILPGRAKNNFFARVRYPLEKWSFSYELDVQNERFFDTANLLKAKNRTLQNIRLTHQSTKSLMLGFSINNFNNTSYEDFRGFVRPGRAWTLSINYQPQLTQ